MNLIKLNAIDSTNDFLKSLMYTKTLDSFTVVCAQTQTKGKGQMGTTWHSESGKNLIMSVLINNFITDVTKMFTINIIFSVSLIQVLQDLCIPELSIKWPNDIMSYQKKIGGILIENSIKSDASVSSVIGLGLNVNQINFENLPKASSLALVSNTTFDSEEILVSIVNNLRQNIDLWNNNVDYFCLFYNKLLFKSGVPMLFKDQNHNYFMGIIRGISAIGKLEIVLEDETLALFDLKEIQMLY